METGGSRGRRENGGGEKMNTWGYGKARQVIHERGKEGRYMVRIHTEEKKSRHEEMDTIAEREREWR